MTKVNITTTLRLGLLLFLVFILKNDSFCQDQDTLSKILVVEKVNLDSLDKSQRHYFNKGSHIQIRRYSNNTKLMGKLNAMTDSTITIKDNIIPIKDIKIISHSKIGAPIAMSGAALTMISFALATIYSEPYGHTSSGDNLYHGILNVAIIGIAFSPIIIAIGIITTVAIKNYHLDKDYKLYIKSNLTK